MHVVIHLHQCKISSDFFPIGEGYTVLLGFLFLIPDYRLLPHAVVKLFAAFSTFECRSVVCYSLMWPIYYNRSCNCFLCALGPTIFSEQSCTALYTIKWVLSQHVAFIFLHYWNLLSLPLGTKLTICHSDWRCCCLSWAQWVDASTVVWLQRWRVWLRHLGFRSPQ